MDPSLAALNAQKLVQFGGNLYLLGRYDWIHREMLSNLLKRDIRSQKCYKKKQKIFVWIHLFRERHGCAGSTFKAVSAIWVFPKIGEKNPKWMVKIMGNPIKMDDLGVPFSLETPMCSFLGWNHFYEELIKKNKPSQSHTLRGSPWYIYLILPT